MSNSSIIKKIQIPGVTIHMYELQSGGVSVIPILDYNGKTISMSGQAVQLPTNENKFDLSSLFQLSAQLPQISSDYLSVIAQFDVINRIDNHYILDAVWTDKPELIEVTAGIGVEIIAELDQLKGSQAERSAQEMLGLPEEKIIAAAIAKLIVMSGYEHNPSHPGPNIAFKPITHDPIAFIRSINTGAEKPPKSGMH